MENTEKRAVSLEQLKQMAQGELIDIPAHDGRTVMSVRIRRIDLTPFIMGTGLLPNQLKLKATEVFDAKMAAKAAEEQIKQEINLDLEKMMPVLEAVAKEALLEPTYQQFQDTYPLTLNQKMAIFNEVSSEVQQLARFRNE